MCANDGVYFIINCCSAIFERHWAYITQLWFLLRYILDTFHVKYHLVSLTEGYCTRYLWRMTQILASTISSLSFQFFIISWWSWNILKELLTLKIVTQQIILDVTSDMAALEVGGGPWFNTWKGEATTPELLSRALRAPVDVDGIFGLIPLFKPPGL